jgi:hypothetical protein
MEHLVDRPTPRALAELAAAVAARETADACYEFVAHLGDDAPIPERLARARRVRANSADLWQREVLAALLEGDEPAWDLIAACIGWNVASLRSMFEETVEMWRAALADAPTDSEGSVGHLGDVDPVGTAAVLDAWVERHWELWDNVHERPVQTALQRS